MKQNRLLTSLLLLILLFSITKTPGVAAVNTSNSAAPGQITPQCETMGEPCYNLEAVKTADAPVVAAGTPVGFKIKVTNIGELAVTDVTLLDQLPSGLTWSVDNASCAIDANNKLDCWLGKLEVAQSVFIHVTATTPTTMCATLTNTAYVRGDGVNELPSNQATVQVSCAAPAPDLTLTKQAAAASVAAGGTLRFILSVSNSGTGPAQGVLLTDPLPSLPGLVWAIDQVTGGGSCVLSGGSAVCDLGVVDPGATRTVTLSSPTTVDSCGVVSNTATVTAANETEDATANNAATANMRVVDCPPPAVTVTKTADSSTVNLNQPLGFSITARNTGTTTVKNFRLTDPLSTGLVWTESEPACSIDASNNLTCNFGDLPAGGLVSVHVSAPAGASACGDLANIALVVGDNLPQQASNVGMIHINCAPDVSITKVANPKEIQFFQNSSGAYQSTSPSTFTITINNHGSAAAQDIAITDTLPVLAYPGQPANTGLTWTITQAPAGGTCAITDAVLSCTFASLGIGQSDSVVISSPTDQIPAPASLTAEFANTVSMTVGNEPVENRTDDQSTATVKLSWAMPLCVSNPPYNGGYFDNFSPSDPNAAAGWSVYQIDHTRNGTNTPFMGRFTNGGTTLTLGCLPVNTYLTLSFDLYVIGSMDGNAIYADTGKQGPGPDVMKFLVADPSASDPVAEGQMLLQSTFTNWSFMRQAYPGSYPGAVYPYRTGAVAHETLGFDYNGLPMDSIYHLRLTFFNTRETQMFVFNGSGLQSLADESWGINNVAVNGATVTFLPLIFQR